MLLAALAALAALIYWPLWASGLKWLFKCLPEISAYRVCYCRSALSLKAEVVNQGQEFSGSVKWDQKIIDLFFWLTKTKIWHFLQLWESQIGDIGDSVPSRNHRLFDIAVQLREILKTPPMQITASILRWPWDLEILFNMLIKKKLFYSTINLFFQHYNSYFNIIDFLSNPVYLILCIYCEKGLQQITKGVHGTEKPKSPCLG